MSHTRCNYCGQVVNFIDIRGNSTCPVCRQSSTSCCEGGSCTIAYTEPAPKKEERQTAPSVVNTETARVVSHA